MCRPTLARRFPIRATSSSCRQVSPDSIRRIAPSPTWTDSTRFHLARRRTRTTAYRPSVSQKRRKIGEKSLTHGGTFTRRFLRLVPPFVLLETQHTRGILTNRATHEFGGTPLDTDRRRSSSRARSTVVAEPLGRDGWASIARPSAWTRRDRRRLTATKRTVNEARVARRGRHLSLPTYGDCYPRSCARVRERGGSRWWLVAWRHALD